MIKAEELRIGNVISYNPFSNIISVTRGNFRNIWDSPGKYSPIELTPDVLRKIKGVYSSDEGNVFYFKDYSMVIESSFGGYAQSYYDGVIGVPMVYLHELQNRYYSFTGKELEIEL